MSDEPPRLGEPKRRTLPGRRVAVAVAVAVATLFGIGLVLLLTRARQTPSWGGQLGVAGCKALLEGSRCEVASTGAVKLTLWFDSEPASTRVQLCEIDPCRELPRSSARGGLKVELALPPNWNTPAVLRILRQDHERGSREFRHELELIAANQGTPGRNEAVATARAAYERGRQAADAGRIDQAVRDLSEAARAMQEQGRPSDAQHFWLYLAYSLTNAHRFDQARASLNQARAVPDLRRGLDLDRKAMLEYSQGMYWLELGELGRAAQHYEVAREWVERGASKWAPYVETGLALTALRRGHSPRATELFRRQLDSALDAGACFRALLYSNLGWSELMSIWEEIGDARAQAQVTEHLRAAVQLFDAECASAPRWQVLHARLSLAFDAVRRGRFDEAQELLAAAGSFDDHPRQRAWAQTIRAELLLARGQPKAALALFLRVTEWAKTTLDLSLAWRGHEGAGRASLTLGETDSAITQFRAAEARLSSALSQIPLQDGQLVFLGGSRRSIRGLITALVERGRTPEAFAAAREARRRLILRLPEVREERPSAEGAHALIQFEQSRRQLEKLAAAAWEAPSDELERLNQQIEELKNRAENWLAQLLESRRKPLPAPVELRAPQRHEALLLWTQALDGWHGFLATESGLAHTRINAQPSDDQRLEPWRSQLARSTLLTLLDESPSRDFDPLAWLAAQGSALEQLPVRYSLDLPPRPPKPGSSSRSVIIASDPRGDLPEADSEARAVRELYTAAGWSVTHLRGREVTRTKLQSLLGSAELFHYAGHAEFAGDEGWQSGLRLLDGPLQVADVLTWSATPRVVFLSACEGATTSTVSHVQGIGVAQSFILAGSSAAIASTRDVPDREARQIAVALTERLRDGEEPAEALRKTRDVQRGAYRVWVP